MDYEFVYSFSKEILNLHNAIRWVGISNKFGVLINTETRPGLQTILTDEENEEYASTAISRRKSRLKYESKIGKLLYAMGRYEKINRLTVPINDDYYLLLTTDKEYRDFDSLFLESLLPLIREKANYFKED